MEKEVMTNCKHEQDFKINEDYNKDLRFERVTSRGTVRMDACVKVKEQSTCWKTWLERKRNGAAVIKDNTGETLCPLNKKKNSLCWCQKEWQKKNHVQGRNIYQWKGHLWVKKD